MRILQFLQLPLKDIEGNLEYVKEQGFDVIQLTPLLPL